MTWTWDDTGLWMVMPGRVSLWAMAPVSVVDFIGEKSRPMPILGVRARCRQSRRHDAVALPAIPVAAPRGHRNIEPGGWVSGILGLSGENGGRPKAWQSQPWDGLGLL